MFYAIVIFISAFLIFLVQPLIAKQILPWFGGSAAVWGTCLLFFQSALLAGYAYADVLTRTRNNWITLFPSCKHHTVNWSLVLETFSDLCTIPFICFIKLCFLTCITGLSFFD